MSLLTGRAAPLSTVSPEPARLAGLFKQVATGDTDAFAVVYAILAPRVWAMAEALTCDRDLAEAAAVQAFGDLWHAAPDCPSEPEAATAWAMRIAVRHSVRAAGVPRSAAVKPPTVAPPAASERRSRHARQALLALPEPQRDAILLSCYGRLSLGVLARTLDVPKQEAAALLCAALGRIEEALRVTGFGLGAKTL